MSRLTICLFSALLLGTVSAGPSVVFAQPQTPNVQTTPRLSSVDRVLDSLVSVTAARPAGPAGPSSRGWSPFPGTLLPFLGSGTGFVVGNGEILTSARLVQGNPTVTVRTRGGQTLQANVVGTNPERDLALLRVTNPPASLNRPVTLGNSDRLTSGQKLIAVGLTGDGGFTAQEVGVRAVGAGSDELTLDTPLNAQARGGPLVNAQGEVVALATGRFGLRLDQPFLTGVSGAALPINAATSVLADLRAGRQAPQTTPQGRSTTPQTQRPRLGVEVVALSDFTVAQLRDANLPTEGLLVQRVLPGTPAALTNLSAGSAVRRLGGMSVRVDADVIVAVNGQRVRTVEELRRAVNAVGATVELELVRSGQTRRVTVTLDSSAGVPT